MSAVVRLTPHHDKLRFRGCKLITVDHEVWGCIHINYHGSRGASYSFQQLAGNFIQEPAYINHRGVQIYRDVKIWSAKKTAREAKQNEFPIAPPDARLLKKAEEFVRDGQLRSPNIVRAEQEAEHAKIRAGYAAERDAKLAAFRAKAYECIKSPSQVDAIVEALLWAQSQ